MLKELNIYLLYNILSGIIIIKVRKHFNNMENNILNVKWKQWYVEQSIGFWLEKYIIYSLDEYKLE